MYPYPYPYPYDGPSECGSFVTLCVTGLMAFYPGATTLSVPIGSFGGINYQRV